jgi:hypothetical protein
MTAKKAGSPPAGLGVSGRTLWREVTGWTVDGRALVLDPIESAALFSAAKIADTVSELETAAAKEPAMVEGSKGQQVVNPLLAEIRIQRTALRQMLNAVKLPGPVTALEQMTPSQRARMAARSRWSS